MLRLFGLLTVQLLVIRALPHSDHLPNTKSNRWVYVALEGCQQKGLLEFHEGAQFRIYSTVSRTDVARAALSAYNLLWWQVKDWQKRLDALPIGDPEVSVSELRAELDALRQEAAGIDAKSTEMRGLIRISNEFEPELTGIGVNVKAMRTFLEDMIPRIGHSTSGSRKDASCLQRTGGLNLGGVVEGSHGFAILDLLSPLVHGDLAAAGIVQA